MTGETEHEVPEGAAVLPLIPEDAGVDPVLLAVLHAVVFLAGSDDAIVQPDAADEAVDCMASYLERLRGTRLQSVRDEMAKLVTYAQADESLRPLAPFLQSFQDDFGIGSGERA